MKVIYIVDQSDSRFFKYAIDEVIFNGDIVSFAGRLVQARTRTDLFNELLTYANIVLIKTILKVPLDFDVGQQAVSEWNKAIYNHYGEEQDTSENLLYTFFIFGELQFIFLLKTRELSGRPFGSSYKTTIYKRATDIMKQLTNYDNCIILIGIDGVHITAKNESLFTYYNFAGSYGSRFHHYLFHDRLHLLNNFKSC